jgi:hypothetical protein
MSKGETMIHQIPDFSRCGYMGGGTKVPHVPSHIYVPPCEGDATRIIQAAIDEVSGLALDENGYRGAVFNPSSGEVQAANRLPASGHGEIAAFEAPDESPWILWLQ